MIRNRTESISNIWKDNYLKLSFVTKLCALKKRKCCRCFLKLYGYCEYTVVCLYTQLFVYAFDYASLRMKVFLMLHAYSYLFRELLH